jgi:hypothetical protein
MVMIMTKEELAGLLNNRGIGHEITKGEALKAKENGLVVIFGYSDDGAVLQGAINDEVDCYDGGGFFINEKGLLPVHSDDCDCQYCGYEQAKKEAIKIEAIWDSEGYSWIYKTDVVFTTFDIMEGEEKYCRGIVIDMPMEGEK